MTAPYESVMLTSLRAFFDRHLTDQPHETEADAERRARLAAAALLIEVARSDEQVSQPERAALLGSVRRRFGLDAGEAAQLLELAEAQARDAHDLYQFTSKINATFSPAQKAELIEELWRAAYADARLHKYEEHLIRRVADLLHVPHAAFIATKLSVRAALLRSRK
ncbi:MAG TPA: TerB family tellurite resistance protein [Steroidobacteraceae bacterium]|nr:TerB family tellurite resistance protein [Steroidobacteraceae bacterium]